MQYTTFEPIKPLDISSELLHNLNTRYLELLKLYSRNDDILNKINYLINLKRNISLSDKATVNFYNTSLYYSDCWSDRLKDNLELSFEIDICDLEEDII